MQIPIVYFSASGNTKYICKLVKKGMESRVTGKDISVELIPVQSAGSIVFEEISVLGIASPIYEFNFSRVIRRWMKNIPTSGELKKVFFIDTSGGIPGSAVKLAEKRMKMKSYHSIGALEVPTPTLEPFASNRWNLGMKWVKRNLDTAYYFGAILGKRILNDKDEYLDFTIRIPGQSLFTRITRFFENSSTWKKLMRMGDIIAFDSDKCIKCRKCEKSCPMGVIRTDRGGIINPYDCMFCATCVRTCPRGAIYIYYRPKAVLPKKDEGPPSIKGYIDPDYFVHSKNFVYSKGLLELFLY